MQFQVTLDHIESGQATLLIRPQETQKLVWPVEYLPEGSEEGDILTIGIEPDPNQTSQAQERAKSLLERLLQKNSQ